MPPNPRQKQPAPTHAHHTHQSVHPLWLLKALGLSLLAALLCGYLALCLLFYQGQWQLVLHPSRPITATPASSGLKFEDVKFDYTEAGQPQLTGWWIPAEPGVKYSTYTILYLHGADGSLSDCVPELASLHALGFNLFAFDYRGYGASAGRHPSQSMMQDDSEAAFEYLTQSRNTLPGQIVLYGNGVGAALATNLAERHSSVPALALESPMRDQLVTVLSDPRSRLIPLRLLLKERFSLSPLATLATPKFLFLQTTGKITPEETLRIRLFEDLSKAAADPKMTVQSNGPAQQSLSRFLDEYLAQNPAPLR